MNTTIDFTIFEDYNLQDLDMKREAKATLAILVLFACWFLMIKILGGLLTDNYSTYNLIVGCVAYLASLLIAESINGRIGEILRLILQIPLIALNILTRVSLSVGIFLMAIFFYLFFPALPTLLFSAINYTYHFFQLSDAVLLFLNLTIPALLIVLFHEHYVKMVTWGVLKLHDDGTNRFNQQIHRITGYTFNYRTIKFLIYSAYFLYLFTYSLYAINQRTFLGDELDMAIMQSFLTFLAFEQLVANRKDFVLRPSQLFARLTENFKINLDDSDKTP